MHGFILLEVFNVGRDTNRVTLRYYLILLLYECTGWSRKVLPNGLSRFLSTQYRRKLKKKIRPSKTYSNFGGGREREGTEFLKKEKKNLYFNFQKNARKRLKSVLTKKPRTKKSSLSSFFLSI